jgi:dipeptidyl aminopeptidase/acylaminoacyl peptidase
MRQVLRLCKILNNCGDVAAEKNICVHHNNIWIYFFDNFDHAATGSLAYPETLMQLRSVLLAAYLAACYSSLLAAPKVPLSAFVQEEEYSKPRLSPDGKHIALTVRVPIGDRFIPVIMTYSLPDMKQVGAIRLPAFGVPANYTWVSNTRLIVTKARELGSREVPKLTGEVVAVNLDGSKQEYLYGYNMYKESSRGDRYGDDYGWGAIADIPEAMNGHFLLGSQLWGSSRSMLYDVDSVNATRKLVADLPEPYLRFVIQQDGKPRFALGTGEDSYLTIYRRNDATGNWEKQSGKMGKRYSPKSFSADDTEFAVVHSKDGGPDQLFKENLATGASTVLYAAPQGSVDHIMYGAKPGLPFGAASAVGIPKLHYFDANSDDAKLHKMLSDQFPGSFVNFVNFTSDGTKLLFSVASDRDPGAYYLYNKLTGKADMLFAGMSAIEPDDMSERRPVSFKARDGLDMHGYLTMPKHAAGAKLPLVLLPHGGPHDIEDTWFFDTDAQFLASRGYAVLQVNFRGSGSRGVNFEEAGYRQWGAQIQDDLIDGVKWAIAQGEVDGNRICAYGVSFGGYSALMLAAREPAMFKCAVGYAGIYDLNLLYKEDATRRDKTRFNIIDKYIGQDKEQLNRFSPVLLASQITSPVMLVHGEKDKVAPFEHAEAMRAALVKVNRAPEWMAVPNEEHGFYDTKNVTKFYEKLEAFLEKHIGK